MKILKIIMLTFAILSGWLYSIYIAQQAAKLKEQMISNGYKEIAAINVGIDTIQQSKAISVNELKLSRDKIDAILKETAKRKTDTLSLDDALKLIQGISK